MFPQIAHRVRTHLRRLQDGSAAGRHGAHQRLNQQIQRIIPWRNDEGHAPWLRPNLTAVEPEGGQSRDALGPCPSRKLLYGPVHLGARRPHLGNGLVSCLEIGLQCRRQTLLVLGQKGREALQLLETIL